jgi:hypothetical protein
MIRQILGSVSQFEKAMLVAKLRGARERKKAITGKCGGRMSYLERSPDAVALAKKLARYPVNGRRRAGGKAMSRLLAHAIPRPWLLGWSRPDVKSTAINNGSLVEQSPRWLVKSMPA